MKLSSPSFSSIISSTPSSINSWLLLLQIRLLFLQIWLFFRIIFIIINITALVIISITSPSISTPPPLLITSAATNSSHSSFSPSIPAKTLSFTSASVIPMASTLGILIWLRLYLLWCHAGEDFYSASLYVSIVGCYLFCQTYYFYRKISFLGSFGLLGCHDYFDYLVMLLYFDCYLKNLLDEILEYV